MAKRADPCPPELRDLRDVVVDALVAKILAELRAEASGQPTPRWAANVADSEAAA